MGKHKKKRKEIVRDWYKGDHYKGTGTMREMAESNGMTYKRLAWLCTPSSQKALKYENCWFKLDIDE